MARFKFHRDGVLLLNASFEPLAVVPLRRAVVLVLDEKADLIEARDRTLSGPSLTVPVPSVIRLRSYVRVPYRRHVGLSRRGVLTRDGHRCQYCGDRADTIDHVQPRSRGGVNSWENLVAACRPCNHRKGDRLLSELGWTLPREPQAPRSLVWLIVGVAHRADNPGVLDLDPAWERWLPAA